ncbi:hypothetical protein A249_17923 [Pseudomonas syringae pv. actinidiae ICMP 18804]|nr:hypothetical protein A249_17923 [Pseudomonas syringae pv. actinidiae ICMP 18804]
MLQNFEPRHAWQAQVEHNKVVGLACALIDGITPISQPVDRIALSSQRSQQLIRQGNMVFNQ